MSNNPFFLNKKQIELIEQTLERLVLEGKIDEAISREMAKKIGVEVSKGGRVRVTKPDPALKGETTPSASQRAPETPVTPKAEPEVSAANQAAGSTPKPRLTPAEKSRANRERARQEQQTPPSKPETPAAPTAKPDSKMSTSEKLVIGGAVAAPVAAGAFIANKDHGTPAQAEAPKPAAKKDIDYLSPTPVEKQAVEPSRMAKPSEKDIFAEPAKTPRVGSAETAAPQKPAAAPKPAPTAPKAETPAPAPKSREMYQQATDMANRGENDTAAYWRAVAQQEKEQGRTAPNDFSDSAVGKFFSGLGGKKKVDEASKYLSMNPSSVNMFAEAKKLTKKQDQKLDVVDDDKIDEKDFAALRAGKKNMEEEVEQIDELSKKTVNSYYDKNVKQDSGHWSPDDVETQTEKKRWAGYKMAQRRRRGEVKMSEELKGDQDKIDANKNGKVDAQDFKILRGKKKMEEAAEPALKKSTTSDPDFAAPSANPDAPESPIKYVPAANTSSSAPSNPPLPPKRPAGLKEAYLDMLKRK